MTESPVIDRLERLPHSAEAIKADRSRAPLWQWLAVGLVAFGVLAAAAVQAREAPQSFADLAEKLSPSVVNVSTTQVVRERERSGRPEMPQFPPGSPFEDFFKEFFDKQRPDRGPRKATSLGSGFIIDGEGLVVTNNHVIADADEINVILHDGTSLKAEVVGRDAKTDLALLRVKSKTPLTAAKWGSSDEARIGDWVLAIGNPFGLGGTVTAGIISARARDIQSGPYDDFIQTDASINRGNSGGPLFNMKGEIVGINTAIFSPSGGSIGIGFAIPSTLAKNVIEDLRKHGKTRRGWLGVRIQSVNEEISESLGLKNTDGALIAGVNEGGPAAKGGIKAGDVVLKFDGKRIAEMRRLPRVVAETPIGKEAEVQIWRDGKPLTLKVIVGELDESETAEAKTDKNQRKKSQSKSPAASKVPHIGLTISALTPEIRERHDISDDARGVIVTEVDPKGAAAEKGIVPGVLIVEINQVEINTPAELVAKVEEAKKAGRKTVLLLIDTEAGMRYVPLKLDGK
jgi:serine protease Do